MYLLVKQLKTALEIWVTPASPSLNKQKKIILHYDYRRRL
jgi:hypothetical protein